MKKYLTIIAVLGLLSACGGKETTPEIAATGISLDKTSLTIEKGSNEVLKMSFTPSNATKKTVTWMSSNTGIATVTDGVVVGVEVGSTEIIAKCGDLVAKCPVTVVVSAKGIKLDKSTLEFKALGETQTLVATVEPSNTTDPVEWSSSDESVVTVADGVVTSVGAGTAEVTAKCAAFEAKCAIIVEIIATSISLDKTTLTLVVGDSETLVVTVEPTNSTDKVEWSSSDEAIATVKDGVVSAVAEGSATITAKAGAQTATCAVTVKKAIPAGAVDLGLSVYWAECNLGATSPEKYGYYFAWGEVEPNKYYNWASYKWANGDYNKLTKYCPADEADYWDGEGEPDGKTVLDPEDDAAHVILGGSWRMPTRAEQSELIAKCTWTWDDTKKGYTVTGTNGNSIFLPAAGRRSNTDLNVVGSWGYYWSSSLDEYYPGSAFFLYFDSSLVDWYYGRRCRGLTVRPVTE